MISRNTKMKRKQRKINTQNSNQVMAMKAAANAVANYTIISGIPAMGRQWLEKYREEHPEFWPQTIGEIGNKSGVTNRISCLMSIFMQLNGIQDLLMTETEKWMTGFGIVVKGVRSCMNACQRDNKNLIERMIELMQSNRAETMNDYRTDMDGLLHKILRWCNTPYAWQPGDPLCLESFKEAELERLRIENLKKKQKNRNANISFETTTRMMSVSKTRLSDEELKTTDYAIGQIIHEDSNKIVRDHIKSRESAIRIARRMLSKNPNATYVVFEAEYVTKAACTLWPVSGITVPELKKTKQAKQKCRKESMASKKSRK